MSTTKERLVAARKAAALKAAANAKKAKQKTPDVDMTSEAQTALNYAKLRADMAQYARGNAEFLRPDKGRMIVRFLMTTAGETFYETRRAAYLPVGGNGGKGKTFISPKTEDDSAYCPLCVVADALKKAGNESNNPRFAARAKELGQRLFPKTFWLSNVLLKDGSTWVLKVFEYKQTIWKALVNQMAALTDENDIEDGMLVDGNIAHPKTGCQVVIDGTGDKLKREYTVTIQQNKIVPATKEQLAARIDLQKFCKPDSDEDIEEALCEFFNVDSFDALVASIADENIELPLFDRRNTDDDEPPRRAKKPVDKKKKPVRKPVDEDEEENDGEDEDEEDEEETETADDSEDDEDADAEEEEEFPPCLALYGKPAKGFKCKTCTFAEECKTVTATE